MSTDTQSLDRRIREKAHKELENRLEDAAQPLRREMSGSMTIIQTKLFDEEGNPVRAREALTHILDATVAALSEREQDKAIETFLRKVDSLQEQIDHLQSSIDR